MPAQECASQRQKSAGFREVCQDCAGVDLVEPRVQPHLALGDAPLDALAEGVASLGSIDAADLRARLEHDDDALSAAASDVLAILWRIHRHFRC